MREVCKKKQKEIKATINKSFTFNKSSVNFFFFVLFKEAKQMDILDQFRDVVTQYGDLKRQSATNKKQHQEELKRKNDQVKRVLRRSEELNKTVEDQKAIIKEVSLTGCMY